MATEPPRCGCQCCGPGGRRRRRCWPGRADGGGQVMTVAVDPAGLDRDVLAAALRAIAGAGEISGVSGVVSLLAVDEAEYAGVPAGLAGTLALVQALGEAGIEARLW